MITYRPLVRPSVTPPEPLPPRTYCAKYDRLAAGDEVFCDQPDYCIEDEEEVSAVDSRVRRGRRRRSVE